MKHYVLTPARRGPEQPIDVNRRRIDLCRGVTARSLAAQGTDWTWIVYVHPDDPLLDERMDAFRSAGAPVIPIDDDPAEVIDWSGPVLTTRIDDDDGFAPDAFARLHRRVRNLTRRTALMFPFGYRTWGGRADYVRHRRNAWSSIFAPAGDRSHVRMVKHHKIADLAPISVVDSQAAWLWVRHRDTDSGFQRASGPLTPAIRSLFPVDWGLLA